MKRILLILPLLTLATGCATVTRGTTEAMIIETDPAGANVVLSTGETCRSPCTLEKKRKDGFDVMIEKAGFETVEVAVISQTANAGAAGMAGNVVLGGLIGMAVDAGSGAMKELSPNPLQVKLVPTAVAREEESGEAGQEKRVD